VERCAFHFLSFRRGCQFGWSPHVARARASGWTISSNITRGRNRQINSHCRCRLSRVSDGVHVEIPARLAMALAAGRPTRDILASVGTPRGFGDVYVNNLPRRLPSILDGWPLTSLADPR
jgi:hypothetical protein